MTSFPNHARRRWPAILLLGAIWTPCAALKPPPSRRRLRRATSPTRPSAWGRTNLKGNLTCSLDIRPM